MKISCIKYVLMLLSVFACTNPFSTREPQNPAEDSSVSTWTEPFEKSTVFRNLRNALIEKNVENYKKCFIDTNLVTVYDFEFLPDPLLIESFTDWSLEDEEEYFRSLVSQIDSISVGNLNPDHFNEINNSTIDVETTPIAYEIHIKKANIAHRFKGQALMRLYRNPNSKWAIYYWKDEKLETDSTWSLLKKSRFDK